MLAKVLITLTTAALALTFTAAAQAATPRQANARISGCLEHAGALRVTRDHVAHFGGRRDGMGWDRWVSWQVFALDWDGQVTALMTSSNRLNHWERRAANRCMRPYGGGV